MKLVEFDAMGDEKVFQEKKSKNPLIPKLQW